MFELAIKLHNATGKTVKFYVGDRRVGEIEYGDLRVSCDLSDEITVAMDNLDFINALKIMEVGCTVTLDGKNIWLRDGLLMNVKGIVPLTPAIYNGEYSYANQ